MKLKSIHLFMLFLFFLIIAPFVNPLVEGMGTMRTMGDVTGERSKQDQAASVKENFQHDEWDSDAYALKSQMVPPVCPACPKKCDKQREKPCPPCPPPPPSAPRHSPRAHRAPPAPAAAPRSKS